MWNYIYNDELCHYGVMGMKWGVRRYQNPDGSLTKAGQKRYNAYKETARILENHSKYAKEDADRLEKKRAKMKPPTESQLRRILNEDYGNDWKDKKYFETIVEKTPKEYATERYYEQFGSKGDIEKLRAYSSKTAKMAKEYSSLATTEAMKRQNYKKAKKFVNGYNWYSISDVLHPTEYNDKLKQLER